MDNKPTTYEHAETAADIAQKLSEVIALTSESEESIVSTLIRVSRVIRKRLDGKTCVSYGGAIDLEKMNDSKRKLYISIFQALGVKVRTGEQFYMYEYDTVPTLEPVIVATREPVIVATREPVVVTKA